MRVLSFVAVFATSVVATRLYVSSYAGYVHSISLNHSPDGTYSLSNISATNGCSPNPSWLTLDHKNAILYCVDEGFSPTNGSISSFKTSENGTLSLINKLPTIAGPVHAAILGNCTSLVLSHYGGAAISTFAITHGGNITATGSHHFNLTRPAPLPARQAAAHPHQAVVDPTGKFLVIPDLGADLIRVFGIGISGALTEQDPFGVSLGSGPRHSVFWRANGVTYLFIITEISNTVIQFSVKYTTAGISLQRVGEISTFGKQPAPSGAAAGEIAISPDKKFLVLSNRNDSSFSLPNHNPQNSTRELSDSLATFSLDLSQPSNSCIRFVELFPAGGSFPRQFSFNKKGDMVAVGLQLSGRVMVFSRDVNTGAFGYPLAEIDIDGQVSCVIWDE